MLFFYWAGESRLPQIDYLVYFMREPENLFDILCLSTLFMNLLIDKIKSKKNKKII